MMCRTSIPRVAMKSKMKVGMCCPAITSGSDQTSLAYGRTSSRRRFGDGCVVISEASKRSRSSHLNQSIVPLSDPP